MKFYVKLWIPATEMFVLFAERDSWDETVTIYRHLSDSGLIAITGRNEEVFQA